MLVVHLGGHVIGIFPNGVASGDFVYQITALGEETRVHLTVFQDHVCIKFLLVSV